MHRDLMQRIIVGVLIALVIIFGLYSIFGAAKAQEATSSSSASANVTSTATASSAGGSVYIAGNPSDTASTVTYRGGYDVKQSGTSTIRSAPAVQAPSMGSGHPCAMSGSVGISIIGGGVSGGNMKVDEACLLAQMGQGEAALIMIARRDREACLALRSVGRIPSNSVCYKGEKSTATAPVSSTPKCPQGSSWNGRGCYAKSLRAVQR